MAQVEITTVSQKGQVVIPQDIREKLGVKEGMKFAVYGSDGMIILKRLNIPTVKDFERLVDSGTRFARQKGIKEKDVLEDD
jgi:AbrB family looped-hinge helix DNA binding protein